MKNYKKKEKGGEAAPAERGRRGGRGGVGGNVTCDGIFYNLQATVASKSPGATVSIKGKKR